ncbi:MAG: phosphoribosylanthranilate isomerase [Burkholderiales bacterium]|uniref:phosphoribosylanthranilate isomerase n=1 Tax=Nitrosomonas sp. TaxID=42353 RepID=UPI001D261126|nr:phosphoribosylanthranilate isomerase [Nitrosomonas sp.]MCB1949199.1 phosphoribosylanthranilate isomerase [Nitrosomonas sp.]MCP5242650.1 phosphoribosylanthranilate isomerase [Burkholderiales bacterium]
MVARVKICGITRIEDALAAVNWGADAVGFVFWPNSSRYITPQKAAEISANLPAFICTVGVYVDPDPDWVNETATIAKLSLLQFHGDEQPDFCSQFFLPYIKAIRVKEDVDLLQYANRYNTAKGLLLDTYTKNMPGGTGSVFDWNLIPRHLPLPVVLSGGLNAENISMAVKQVRPWAVDVSSGVEIAKGIKDEQKISAFMQGVREE